jgi:hypothetical protein
VLNDDEATTLHRYNWHKGLLWLASVLGQGGRFALAYGVQDGHLKARFLV